MAEATDIFIEHDGMLFKGFAPAWPTHIWDFKAERWRMYAGPTPKDETWGTQLTLEEFEATKAELAAIYADD